VIEGLKPYPQMKDSGVAWLGDVPEHWRVVPNRVVFDEVKERDHPDADMLSVTITRGVIRQRALLEGSSKKDSSNLDKSAYKFVRPGDIAYNKMRAWQGAIGVSEYEGIVSPAYVVQRPRDGANPHYLHYLLRTPAFAKQAERWSYGITSDMWSLRPEHFKMIYSCLPPFPEQAAIVRFLDHADRRIRRYIRAKQGLIKLLEEQKQAIIHRAVTRGLDPNVRLRPSGVQWLSDVPEHWEVVRLKDIASHIVDCLHATPTYSEEGQFPAIRTADITPGEVHLRSARRVEVETYQRWTERLEPTTGDILYSREGERFGIAACVPPGTRLCISQRMMVFRIRPEHNPLFVMWILNGPQTYAQAMQDIMGSTAPHINVSTIRNFVLALPSIREQCEIVEEIESATHGIAMTIQDAVQEIDLFREYRTRLIADLVTGKLDVREAAARVPDEVDEAEPIDEMESEAENEQAADGETDEALEIAEA
jgi:type I restriction enzyme, S subunit